MMQRIRTVVFLIIMVLAATECTNPSDADSTSGNDADLVGEWTFTRIVMSEEEEYITGISLLLNEDRTYKQTHKTEGIIESGTWSTSGDKLNLTVSKGITSSNTYSIDGDVLIITDATGTTEMFYEKTDEGDDIPKDRIYEDVLWFGVHGLDAYWAGDTNDIYLELFINRSSKIGMDSTYTIDEYVEERNMSRRKVFQEGGMYSINDTVIYLYPVHCVSIHYDDDTTIVSPTSCGSSTFATLSGNKLKIRRSSTTFILTKK